MSRPEYLDTSDSIPGPRSVMREYNRIRKERREERLAENLFNFFATRTMSSKSFSTKYEGNGKLIKILDPEAHYKRCLFFLASNRWQCEDGLDHYGTYLDFCEWYNVNNRVSRFILDE